MSASFYLKYGNDKRLLANWGIDKANALFISFAPDQFSFEIPVSSINPGSIFPYGAVIEIWRDSVRWFVGTITKLECIGTAKRDYFSYVASGPWWALENLVYQDLMNQLVNIGNFTQGVQLTFCSNTVLFQDITGAPITTFQQIIKALTYASSKGANIVTGTVDAGWYVPAQQASDISCAEVIRRCCALIPDAISFFDYTQANPTLNIIRRNNLTTVGLDLNAASLVESVQLNPRYDLQPPGIKIFIKHTAISPSGPTAGQTANSYEIQTAGNADAIGSVVVTIPLSGANTGAPGAEESTPIGLATNYFSAINFLSFEGDLKIKEDVCSGQFRPGKLLNLTNGNPAWATMGALIQSVQENLITGETTVHTGPPTQISVQDFIALLKAIWGGLVGLSPPAARASAAPSSPSFAQAIMDSGIPIQVCDSDTGVSETIYVRSAGS
jgi:hypothetical protein